MKLGLHIGYWGLWMGADEQLQAARAAEAFGYDSLWSSEAYGSDAATVLAWIAGQTSRIKLGSAVFQIPGRSAAMTAMTAASIDRLSGGRMILGLGTSGPQVAEGWHGQRFGQQLQRTREYFDVVRLALGHERVQYAGQTLELPLPDGPGKALKLSIKPIQEQIPLYLAAIGPNNTRLAGEIADGWLPTYFSPEHIGLFRDLLLQGATKSGRTLKSFEIAPTVGVHIDDDLTVARDFMRPSLALYVGGMGSREQNFYNALVRQYGFERQAVEIQNLYLDGKRDEACRAIPDALIDLVCLVGPPERVRERIGAYRDAGVNTLIASPVAATKQEQAEQIRALAELSA